MPQREADKKRRPWAVRLLPEEHAEITQKAEAYGMTFSAYLRACALEKPMPTYKGGAELRNELRRVGGLLKHFYNEKMHEAVGLDPQAFMVLLVELRIVISKIGEANER